MGTDGVAMPHSSLALPCALRWPGPNRLNLGTEAVPPLQGHHFSPSSLERRRALE